MAKKILIALVVILIAIQFIRPAKNTSDEISPTDIAYHYVIPDSVDLILKSACNDCHTNNTAYPWYAELQPSAWFLNQHVTDGKRHLNFTTFTSRNIARQNHVLEEIIETVKEGEMPLPSYTWFGLHPKANISEAQRNTLITWAQIQMDSLKANYPADSLILRRPGNTSQGSPGEHH